MTRLRICALVTAIGLVSLLSSVASAQEWGTLKGKFVFDGKPPTPKAINVTKEPACEAHNLVDESVVVGDDGGLANVVVYLYLGRGKKVSAVHPDYEKTAGDKVVLSNENCRFEPHVALLRTSQTLEIKNADAFGHNTKLSGFNNSGFNKIVAAGTSQDEKLTKVESGPIKFSCNIHPWMNGYVLVRDNPYMAVSAEDGTFEIKNLPVGKHEFQFWQESAGRLKGVKFDGGKASSKGRAKIEIKPGDNDIGEIKVSKSLFK